MYAVLSQWLARSAAVRMGFGSHCGLAFVSQRWCRSSWRKWSTLSGRHFSELSNRSTGSNFRARSWFSTGPPPPPPPEDGGGSSLIESRPTSATTPSGKVPSDETPVVIRTGLLAQFEVSAFGSTVKLPEPEA